MVKTIEISDEAYRLLAIHKRIAGNPGTDVQEMDELFAEAEGAWFIPDGEGQKILTQIKRRTYDRSHPE